MRHEPLAHYRIERDGSVWERVAAEPCNLVGPYCTVHRKRCEPISRPETSTLDRDALDRFIDAGRAAGASVERFGASVLNVGRMFGKVAMSDAYRRVMDAEYRHQQAMAELRAAGDPNELTPAAFQWLAEVLGWLPEDFDPPTDDPAWRYR